MRVLFGVWGGPGDGEERGRDASYRECSRVSEPRRCARVTTHPSLRVNDHMVMPVGTRGWLVTVCTRHSVCNDDGTNVGGRRNEDERGRRGDGRDIACSDREKMDVKT